MSPELAVLRLLCKDKKYLDKYEIICNNILKENHILIIYTSIKDYYTNINNHNYISLDELLNYVTINYSTYKDIKTIIDIINTVFTLDISDSLSKDIINKLIEKDISNKIINKLLPTITENKFNILSSIEEDISEYYSYIEQEDKESPFVEDDIADIIQELVVQDGGLKWRLQCLQDAMGSLQGGILGHVFARPNCLAKGTRVIMYDGSTKAVEDVVLGDLLMGDDSTPRTVLATTSGIDTLYKISYTNGESYTVNSNHVLSLKRSKSEGIHKHGDVLNVPVNEYVTWPTGRKQRYKGWKTGVEFECRSPQNIPPYLLGVWLGDGTSSKPQITSMDSVILNEWIAFGAEYGLTPTFENSNTGQAFSVSIVGKCGVTNPVTSLLKDFGLLNNKHIPVEYLRVQTKDRLALLAGLIDTDGAVSGNGYEITQKSKVLADDILWLVRSLGFGARLKTKMINDAPYYRIYMYGDFSMLPLRLEHKKVVKAPKLRDNLHYGIQVECIGEGEYYGFTLDDNHLFLLEDFTVTHNSGKTSFLASEVTNFAKQLGEGESIIWCNNEERGRKVKLRLFNAMLSASDDAIMRDVDRARTIYTQRNGKAIRLFDSGIITFHDLKELIREYNPRLVVIDQADKIHFKGMTTMELPVRLKELYKHYRELAKENDLPIITVGQASSEAEGRKWLRPDWMDYSKTGKFAEMDFILGLGKTHDEGEKGLRFVNICKNKMKGVEEGYTVKFDHMVSRYTDL